MQFRLQLVMKMIGADLAAYERAIGTMGGAQDDHSELLGEYYCNEEAFVALRLLAGRSDEKARSLTPEHIARGARNEDLRQRALGELSHLKRDASPEVRREAELSLERVRRHKTE